MGFCGSLKGGCMRRESWSGERIIDVAYGKKCEDEEIAKISVESLVTAVKAVAFGAKSKWVFPCNACADGIRAGSHVCL